MIKIRRGDTTTINVVYIANGEPVDLTGSTVYFTVRQTYAANQADDTDALIREDVTSHTNPTEGETTIELSNTQTNVAVGKYKYDVQVKDSDGNITTINIGDCEILPHVTVRTT